MGIQGFPRPTAIVPKAVCHACGRPVAFMKSGKCVYCGQAVPSEGSVATAPAGLSPEILMALEGQTQGGVSGATKWRRRAMAFFLVAVLIAVMIGMFMRS